MRKRTYQLTATESENGNIVINTSASSRIRRVNQYKEVQEPLRKADMKGKRFSVA